ncbi:MAG: hypothetical protein EZS28_008173 [Streblomastix strix]|uniref:Uncharacterized protein n=1 Tax=Streblomastix strix TaxID=222440 RepID=A0A5J4WQ74_9EUKA|nr:MAG: hypothetical protein EZS28_008173 [Streblomastix strix]
MTAGYFSNWVQKTSSKKAVANVVSNQFVIDVAKLMQLEKLVEWSFEDFGNANVWIQKAFKNVGTWAYFRLYQALPAMIRSQWCDVNIY